MNPETSQFIFRKEEKSSSQREAIPLETALAIQTELPLMMAPLRILEHIENGHDELIEPLVSRFMDRYALEWNALDAFCGDISTDPELLERFSRGGYTEEDLDVLVHYIEAHDGTESFFADDGETEAFLAQFLH